MKGIGGPIISLNLFRASLETLMPNFIKRLSLACIAAGLATIGVVAIPGPADAAVPASLSKYCRAKYPNSMLYRQATRWGVRYHCRQVNAHGATLQGINYGEACRMTTGSPQWRLANNVVYCTGRGRTAYPTGAKPRVRNPRLQARLACVQYQNGRAVRILPRRYCSR